MGKGFGHLGTLNKGVGGLSAAMRARALKIVNAAQAYTTRTNMASPPTVTTTAAFAASTVTGDGRATDNPKYTLDSPLIRVTGPLRLNAVYAGDYGGWTTTSALFDGGDGWGVACKTNSSAIELSYSQNGAASLPNKMRLRVNGQWAQTADYSLFTTSDFSSHYVKIDFGSTAERVIEIFLQNLSAPFGINTASGATMALPPVAGTDVSGAFFGDSYVTGNTPGLSNIRNTTAQAVGEIMGIPDIIPFGRGGQGFVKTADGRTIDQRIALDAARISAPDIVFVSASLNDWNQTAATLQANFAAGITSLKSAYPSQSTFIVALTGFSADNGVLDAPHYAAALNGALSVADARVLVIDTSTWPKVSTTGTLPNAAAHDSTDGTHPGPNETAYLSGLVKTAVIAALKARAGIP